MSRPRFGEARRAAATDSTDHIPAMASRNEILSDLLHLAHRMADGRHMAILGEGNVSAALSERQFLVKASGARMDGMTPDQLVEVRSAPLLEAIASETDLTDDDVTALLLHARLDESALKPSVESLFHAWLLSLPEVNFVAHCHAISVNQILCSRHRTSFARERLIPDQVVYCGVESVLVPYVDPGLVLARRIALEVGAFVERTGERPKTILLENHGLIGLGATSGEASAAVDMAEKSARIFTGATALGGPVFMRREQVLRIAGRPDEHYRIRMMRNGR